MENHDENYYGEYSKKTAHAVGIINNALQSIESEGWQGFAVIAHQGDAGTVVSRLNDPNLMKHLVSYYLMSIHSMIKSKNIPPQSQDPYVMNILCEGVMNFMDEMSNVEKYEKFKRFSKGDTEGLTDEEFNEFLDIKLQTQKVEKIERGVVDKLEATFNTLIGKYGISGEFLIPRLKGELYDIFYEYRKRVVIDKVWKPEDYHNDLFNVILEVYLHDLNGRLFLVDFEHETSKYITQMDSNN